MVRMGLEKTSLIAMESWRRKRVNYHSETLRFGNEGVWKDEAIVGKTNGRRGLGL